MVMLRVARSRGPGALGVGILLVALGLAQTPTSPTIHSPDVSPAGQAVNNGDSFPCHSSNSKVPAIGQPRSKHVVMLSWKASVSLSAPLAVDEGYNVYRLNPDGSCTKINGGELVRETNATDVAVELGDDYSYAVTAFKQNSESKASIPVTVSIPPN